MSSTDRSTIDRGTASHLSDDLDLRDSLDFAVEELPRTAARRAARQNQAQARAYAHTGASRRPDADDGHGYAPRVARSYASGRSRIDADGVRTIKIRGQATPPRRRPMIDASRPIARYDQHPDRAAQWALFLGVFMVVVAIVTGS